MMARGDGKANIRQWREISQRQRCASLVWGGGGGVEGRTLAQHY